MLERDPQMVVDDLRAGAISARTAKEIYKVAFDPESLIVDAEQTEALRDQARDERKQLGKPYSEFMQTWAQQSPPEDALKYFGEYPGTVA